MPDLKPIVTLTNASTDNMSRHDMLDWVNGTVHGQYKKIEELCSGVAYCQMMELLFPQCISLKRVKMTAKLEHEQMHNLKLFQSALTRLQMDKSVPMDRLIRGRFQDNFEFLQWFKKFFDTYAAGKENLKVPAALEAAAANQPKPVRRPASTSSPAITQATLAKTSKTNASTHRQQQQHLLTTTKATKGECSPQSMEDLSRSRSVSPGSISVMEETKERLKQQTDAVENDRNFYYNKLLQIEKILNKSLKENVQAEWSQRALNILYKVDNRADNSGETAEL